MSTWEIIIVAEAAALEHGFVPIRVQRGQRPECLVVWGQRLKEICYRL